MKRKLVLSVSLAVLLLDGCGIYTSYQRPESVPADSLYRDVPVTAGDSSSLATLSWRELFTDPRLREWVELGLEKNTDLRIARLKVEEAEAALLSLRLAFLPSVSSTPQGTLSRYGSGTSSKTYSLGASAEWEADVFGGLRNAKRGARASLEQSKAYEQAVQTQLVATIAEIYCSLLMLDRQLAITRQTVVNWEENVRMMRVLKRAGQADEAAVAQAEADKLSAEASALALERQIHELENSFSTLVGIVP